MRYVGFGLNGLLVLVLTVSAGAKVRSRQAQWEFASVLRGWGWLPPRWTAAAAALLSGGEVVLASLLWWVAVRSTVGVLSSVTALIAAGGATLLFLAFAAAVAVKLGRRRAVSCACFSTRATPLRLRHLVRNLALVLAGTVWILVLWRHPGVPTRPGGLLLAASTGCLAAVVLIRIDDVVELFGRSSPALRS